LTQLSQAVHFIAQDNPTAAAQIGQAIIDKALLLGQFPRLGKIYRKMQRDDFRETPVPPYRVIYQIRDEQNRIDILSVWHTAREEPEIHEIL